jgi:cytochrome c
VAISCNAGQDNQRALDPWIVRINLDGRPNMIGLALNKHLFAAYDGKVGGLYKVWKGNINFTGPVFDNLHGPQPSSEGEAYILDTLETSPWTVLSDGQEKPAEIRYQGYTLIKGQIEITYTLTLSSGEVISVTETPEYITKNGKPGFSRIFTTSNVPDKHEVMVNTSFEHLTNENDLESDGQWLYSSFSKGDFDWGSSVKGQGTLKLKSNGSTYLRSFFEDNATAHIEINEGVTEASDHTLAQNPDQEVTATNDLSALVASGKDIIGQNDCAACHQVDKKTIGPSYIMVAQKYDFSIEVVNKLSEKIINGGTGVWGQQPMSAHPNLSESDAKAMAAYILSTVPDSDSERKPGVAVDFYQIGEPLPSLPEVLAGQNPNASEVYPSINFRSGNPDIGEDTDENFSGFVKDFVMQVNGFINVKESKTYELKFIANNGGRLTINGKVLSEGSVYEGTYVEDIEVPLNQGANSFKIDFYHHLFNKYLVLMWTEDADKPVSQEDEFQEYFKGYVPIPPSVYTHNAYQIKPTSSGIKSLVSNKAPGFGASLESIHPAYQLSEVRPQGFEPRVGDLEFQADGSLVLCTWDGEVYRMDNVTSTNRDETIVTKIADGLCEPLGITVVDGDIYVLQRWELTKLVDNDNNGITDEYVNITTFGSNAQFHEWSFGLIYKEGYFYCTTGIAMGYGAENMHVDRGKALKIAMDGSYSHVAYGLKEPNGIGFGPDGEIFVAENEAEYQPVCQILHLPEGQKPFYGNKSVEADNLSEDIKREQPVIWLPQNKIGNSPSQPILMEDGPYMGQLIHGEITHGGIKRDFIEKIKGQYQGAVFRFTQGLEVGINRLEYGPDGSLYAAGLGGAQDFGHQGHQFGLQRLTYTGTPAFEMLAIRAKSNGLEVEFTKPLRLGDGTQSSDYKVQQWHYYWTHEGESQEKRDLENLSVQSVSLSDDRTKVFLELSGMKKEHVLYVQLQPTFLSSENDQLWSNEGWYTLNEFPDVEGTVNPSQFSAKLNQITPPEIREGWQMLFDGKTKAGWRSLPQSNWSVNNGTLVGDGTDDGGIFLTQRSYDNFELELQWKVAPEAEGGVIFNIPDHIEGKNALSIAPRFQLIDDGTEEARAIHTHKSGANYDIEPPAYVVTNPPNQYNELRLVMNHGQVEHWINGIKVLSYQLNSDEWNHKVQASGYAGVNDYGKVTRGLIGLYAGKGQIWVRNIRIRELQ